MANNRVYPCIMLRYRVPVISFILVLFISIGFIQSGLAFQAEAWRLLNGKIVLADNETTLYRIVVPSAANIQEEKAAKVLQDYLLRISGAALPIVTAGKHRSDFEIVLGRNERLDEINANIDFHELERDGFVIKTLDSRLIIAGGIGKGTLFGVYTFLEEYLGARMYSPDVILTPKKERIVLDSIYDIQIPVVQSRYIHYRGTWDEEYVNWNKLSHNEDGSRPDWGLWVHTFNQLVPPMDYFEDHPEYYAMVNGVRMPTQLCLTNTDVLEITVKNLRREMANNPEASYWSVSQNDNQSFCTCDECKAIDEQEESQSGTIIRFVNQIAERFPDKIISTLAYEYSRKAPRYVRPLQNVNIMLCSIEVNRDQPIETDPASADFRRDVVEWGEIADDIILWDYVIQFHNLVAPFPNLHVLKPNVRFFAEHGVTAMFKQGNREVGGEFSELRAWLLAKLLWNPNADIDELMDDFLGGFYGDAGVYIRKYIDTMMEAQAESDIPLRIFGSIPNIASESYLSPERISLYEELFDMAEQAVSHDRVLLERVKVARLPIDFTIMEQAKHNVTGEQGMFEKIDGNWYVRDKILSKIDPFTDLSIKTGISRVKEWSTSPEEYRSVMYRLFYKGFNEHLAFGKPVMFITPSLDILPDEAEHMLTNGVRGGHTFLYNWLGFSGQNLEVLIDLEEIQDIRRIESSYYQHTQWLMILPEKVEYYLSEDGLNFEPAGTVWHDLSIDENGVQIRDFVTEFAPRKGRYIKVIAHTIGNTPSWHPTPAGAGRPARMLVDEIVIE